MTEPPPAHEIATIAELVDLTTAENVDEMVKNITDLLILVASCRTAGVRVALKTLRWVEDGRAGISHVNLSVPL